MAVLDEEFSADLRSIDGAVRMEASPAFTLGGEPCDVRSRHERECARADQEQARADAAEARCEELRWAEVAARSDAGLWKSRFRKCRSKLTAAEEETKALRRAARQAPGLQAVMGRPESVLSESAIESSGGSTIEALRKEIARLHKENAKLRTACDARDHRIGYLQYEARQLRKDLQGAETHKETIRQQFKENIELRAQGRRLRDQQDRVRWQSGELYRLNVALEVSETQNGRLKAKLAKLIAERKTFSKPIAGAQLRAAFRRSREQKKTITSQSKEIRRLRRAVRASKTRNETLEGRVVNLHAVRETLSDVDVDLRNALRRSRRQKTTIKSLSREKARLHRTVKGLRNRTGALEAQLVKLRSTGAVLSRRLYGRKSEQQEKPRSGRQRGQQRGAPGHGRTQRPELEERPEELNPPEETCVCAECGQPRVPNGAEESTLVEIEVKAHKRVIRRPRWRRGCACASSPLEVSAPGVPRLFRGTPYGISVWARVLFELCVCLRPVHRVAAWLSAQGLAVAPGTLANSPRRFVSLFEPLFEAILAHQNTAVLRHADETSWRVRELAGEDRSNRAWLWTSVSGDAVCFHIDASRSAEAALKLFAGTVLNAVIVCDRYSAYKKLVRLLGGLVILAFCWVHMRRDFIEAAAGQARLTQWCQGWIERIAEIYRLNDERLKHYEPDLERQTPAFDAAQSVLKGALGMLFAQAERELATLSDKAREAKALRSLVNHREGLCVFVERPFVPLDNNVAERILRGAAIGRRLSHGSDSEMGAEFTAMLYSVVGTLSMNRIDVLRWLQEWLSACAENGRKPPHDLSPWLPWSMSEARRRELLAPG
ncbi:MAG: IS66 family transposase [Bryobacterales bacterium]|nr:IS66 family transposase [Bryobacterales bacterium]